MAGTSTTTTNINQSRKIQGQPLYKPANQPTQSVWQLQQLTLTSINQLNLSTRKHQSITDMMSNWSKLDISEDIKVTITEDVKLDF